MSSTSTRLGVLALGLLVSTVRAQSPPADPPEPTWTAEQKEHWAFVAPKRVEPPVVKDRAWVKSPVDAFILNTLEGFGLAPAPEADRPTLIRRLGFDLTGLPPTPEEVDAFVADGAPDAYERLVDRMLASPAYGERWARQWLDLARFAESDGFKSDKTRPTAWRYRDWVVDALNRDMPYDRFVALQLAGDEIAPGDPDAFVATGFNRNYPFEDNNMVPGLNRQLMLDDMTDTTASAFLAMTVGCARCHDHKYDPISQKDYYRLQAIFGPVSPKDDFAIAGPLEKGMFASVEAEHRARRDSVKAEIDAVERPYRDKLLSTARARLDADVREAFDTEPEKRTALQEDLVRANSKKMTIAPKAMQAAMTPADRTSWTSRTGLMESLAKGAPIDLERASGMTESTVKAPPVRLLRKGNFKNPGPEIPPGFLSVLAEKVSPIGFGTGTSGRREALARWITSPDNPLTARVIVNRLWLGHFGRGLVSTPSDFGKQGSEPTHPELLDWLATELVRQGWSLKAIHRLMVTSATYRQSSLPPSRTLAEDPENTLLGRMPRRRLEGEAVRDALLAVSGQLDRRVGGPSVFPDLPPGMETRGGWTRSESASDRNRRSLYVFVRRNLKYPLFDAFDFPDTNTTCAERNITVNAPQALMLLNSDLVLDSARALSARVLTTAPGRDAPARVAQAYRLAFGRRPDADESTRALAFFNKQTDLVGEKASFVDFCHVLLNLNEFVFID